MNIWEYQYYKSKADNMNAQQEDSELSKHRNVSLDVMATVHIIDARKRNVPWTCECMSCQYMRQTPKLVESIYKSLDKDSK